MMRGIERREIFVDDHDRRDLLARLDRLIPEWGGDCFAWSFMTNHVHLVLRTGPVPLAKVMHRLNTGFAGRFNRERDRVGYLFQNRFKSRLVYDDADLVNLIRYVHLNPVRSGYVADLGQLACHPWSGHGALVGARTALRFESVDTTLALFHTDADRARTLLLDWMAAADDVAVGNQDPLLTGAVPRGPGPKSVTRRRSPIATVDDLICEVCRYLGASEAAVRSGARTGRESEARAAIAFVAVVRMGYAMGDVARPLGISRQAVGRALERGARIDTDYGPFAPREGS
jgi:putative transposase